MSNRAVWSLVAALLIVLVISCQKKDDGAPLTPDEPCCVLNLQEIDLGTVEVGSYRDTFFVLTGCSNKTVSDTVIVWCSGFDFIDKATGQPTDTFAYSLGQADPPLTDTCYVRFEPAYGGDQVCHFGMGSDCEALNVRGTGATTNVRWRSVAAVVSVDLYDIAEGSQGYWACGDSGTVLYRGNAYANHWTEFVSHGFGNSPLRSIWDSGLGGVWTAGGTWATGGAKIEHYNGATWSEMPSLGPVVTYNAVWGAAQCDIYFGGVNVMSLDGFNLFHWNCIKFDSTMLDMGISTVTGVFGRSSSDVWAVLGQSASNVFRYNGSAWQPKRETWMNQWLEDIWVALNGEAFAVGANGAIYHFKGNAWINESIPGLAKSFRGVWGRSESDVFAVGDGATIYHFNGSTWTAQAAPSGVTADLYSVAGNPQFDVFAVGAGGTIIRYGAP